MHPQQLLTMLAGNTSLATCSGALRKRSLALRRQGCMSRCTLSASRQRGQLLAMALQSRLKEPTGDWGSLHPTTQTRTQLRASGSYLHACILNPVDRYESWSVQDRPAGSQDGVYTPASIASNYSQASIYSS